MKGSPLSHENHFLAVVCYPTLALHDQERIEAYRAKHDVYADLIPAHFTLVFPTFNVAKTSFTEEIVSRSKDAGRFDFEIRCAIMNNDRTNELYHVLLTPDKGFSDIVLLHDSLHSGALRSTQRLDLDFIPHIAIANANDPHRIKAMVNELNRQGIRVNGSCDALDIISFEKGKIRTLKRIILS